MTTQSEAARKVQQRTRKQDSGRKKHLEHWESKLEIVGDTSGRQEWSVKSNVLQNSKRRLNTAYYFNNKEKNRSLFIIIVIMH